MAHAKSNLRNLIREVQEYESQRNKMESCGKSTVQAVNCIVLNSVTHAGVVSHVCSLEAGHVGDCQCADGYHWMQGERR